MPKLAMLTREALAASATATHERLGGPGQWLLPMPAHHIAGLQVLVRSLVAGTEPVAMDLTEGFTPAAFARSAAALTGHRRYTSLVPTQLVRLLADPAGTEALRVFDAVLLGGAAAAPSLLARAAEAGVSVTTTYGMSETAGGCVYDGRPLACTTVRADADGRLHLGGATLAEGYLGRPDLTAAAFSTDADGRRWFATDDVGHQGEDGRWHVDGRIDDLVNTGGLKVAPRLVEEAITARLPEVAECAVVGVPDPEWGEAVAAALVLADGARAPRGGRRARGPARRAAEPRPAPAGRGPRCPAAAWPRQARQGCPACHAHPRFVTRLTHAARAALAPRHRPDRLRGRRLHPDRREPRAQPAQAGLGLPDPAVRRSPGRSPGSSRAAPSGSAPPAAQVVGPPPRVAPTMTRTSSVTCSRHSVVAVTLRTTPE